MSLPFCISGPKRHVRSSTSAFTLSEILISLVVLGTIASGVFVGFTGLNTYSVTSRLYSEAQTAAQNQIDLVLSREPFDLFVSPAKIPIELQTATELATLPLPTTAPTTAPAANSPYYPYYPYYVDAGGLAAKEAFIYTDPETGQIIVRGVITTLVTPINDFMTLENTTTSLNSRRITVTVSYKYRNTNYTVAMDTMRTADR